MYKIYFIYFVSTGAIAPIMNSMILQFFKILFHIIDTYTGYYIARYEASYASGNSTSDYKAASKKSKANSTSSMDYTVGTLWNFITQLDASKVSINTYSKENATVKKLCMGYGNSVYRGSWKYKLCKSN